jgi:glucose/arabinose dehydrogenase
MKLVRTAMLLAGVTGATGCGGGGGGAAPAPLSAVSGSTATATPAAATPSPAPTAGATATPLPGLPLSLNLSNLPGQFYGEIVAQFAGASPRGLAMLPNGDLLAGTGGGTANFAQSGKIFIIPNAESATPAAPAVFATLSDISCGAGAGNNTNGVAFAPAAGGGAIFVGMECSVWKIGYATGDRVASSLPVRYVTVRTGLPPTGSDGDVHHTTSLAVNNNTLYLGVGSSCNACTEIDATRATVLKTDVNTPSLSTAATRVRNALALAVDPATGVVWAGGAGQDCMVGTTCFGAMDTTYALNGHPYEWLDPLTTHAAPVDYQWPWCEENGQQLTAPDSSSGSAPPGTNCHTMIVPSVRAPAYGTIMGATFYAPPAGATYAFPGTFRNGLFFTLHGSWHEDANGIPVAVPQVVFVPIAAGDVPVYPMDWTGGGSPYATWARNASGNPAPFLNGFQTGGTRIGRPAGLAVGPQGSLFISDDEAGKIYRIRPGVAPASVRRSAGQPTRGRPATALDLPLLR